MTRAAPALAAIAWWGVAAACYEERVRPGPPEVELTLTRIEVQSPDTLRGRLRAVDPDGIDSVWLVVDSVRNGFEGFFSEVVEETFIAQILPGHAPGSMIGVRIQARDVLGFVAGRDTFVTIAFPRGAGSRRD